jgi:hypothetical protein
VPNQTKHTVYTGRSNKYLFTDKVKDDAAIRPPAGRPAKVRLAIRRVSQGEGFSLRRVAADADVARLGNGIAEAEHGIVLAATAAAHHCDQRRGGHQQRKPWPPPHGCTALSTNVLAAWHVHIYRSLA